MTRAARFIILLPALLLAACSLLPAQQGDLYAKRRAAQEAYDGNQDERAEALLLGLTRAVPNDGESWFYLGNLYARTNRPEQATEAYQKALMLNRGDPRPWHNLGVVRLRQAWAAFIRSYDLAPPGDALHERDDAVIRAMEKIPLEGLKRKPADNAGKPKE